MGRHRVKWTVLLTERYPPSEPCSCDRCRSFCDRPGWWTVEECARAIEAGLAGRMMLEMSPDRTFGVLSPAFRGNEVEFALQSNATAGCNFLVDGRCELHGSGLQPLECRFCHHERMGRGPHCHADLERSWKTSAGRALVERWGQLTGFTIRKALRIQGMVPLGRSSRFG